MSGIAREITIRPAETTDWPSVSALLRRSKLPLDGAQASLASFLLAFRGDRLVGSVGLVPYDDCAFLRSLAVDEGERGQGLGILLVKHLLERARGDGRRSVVLLTETAAGFFPKFGFREISRDAAPEPVKYSVEFVSTCPLSAVFMHLDLTQ